MVIRKITEELREAAAEYPVVTILGPRQSGKTTLAQMTFPGKPYLSLENPDTRLAAEEDPRGFLNQVEKGAILDEIQRLPSLLSYIQGIVDAGKGNGRFILTGSHQPLLHEAISQSLAGRTSILTLWPFSIPELRNYKTDISPFKLIVKGFYPRLHEENLESRRFYNNYLQTYVERDVRALIKVRDLSLFQKFLMLLAGRIGQVLNLASLGNDIGVSKTTVSNWISVLKASFIIYELAPYFENIGKRVIKSPKLYFTDVGLASFLLGIHDENQAVRDPLRGNLYENFLISEIIKGSLNRGIRPEIYFYRDSNGNEIDLIIKERGKIIPVEIKSGSTFNKDFLKGLKHYQKLELENTCPGFVFFNGEQEYNIHGVQVMNPLTKSEDIWETISSCVS